jgi:hypothetical protein
VILGGNVRLRLHKQLAISNLPVAFQQAIMERPLNDMQRKLCRAIFKHAGGLSCCVKHCLDNIFEAELASPVLHFMHYPG